MSTSDEPRAAPSPNQCTDAPQPILAGDFASVLALAVSGVPLFHVATPDHLLRSVPCPPFPYRRDGRLSCLQLALPFAPRPGAVLRRSKSLWFTRPELRLLLWLGAAPARAGFTVETIETFDLKTREDEARRTRRSAACHTAQIGGYVIEGHVPASRSNVLNDRPSAIGLAVPGMPVALPAWKEGPRSRTTL